MIMKPARAAGGPETMNPRPGASPNGSSPAGNRTDAPRPPAMQHSARATATPPSAMSWALRKAPERTRARTAPCAIRILPRSTPGGAPAGGSARGRLGQFANHPDNGGREDRPARRLVVERDVAADNGNAELFARLGQP